jgi:hypothetical protein
MQMEALLDKDETKYTPGARIVVGKCLRSYQPE